MCAGCIYKIMPNGARRGVQQQLGGGRRASLGRMLQRWVCERGGFDKEQLLATGRRRLVHGQCSTATVQQHAAAQRLLCAAGRAPWV